MHGIRNYIPPGCNCFYFAFLLRSNDQTLPLRRTTRIAAAYPRPSPYGAQRPLRRDGRAAAQQQKICSQGPTPPRQSQKRERRAGTQEDARQGGANCEPERSLKIVALRQLIVLCNFYISTYVPEVRNIKMFFQNIYSCMHDYFHEKLSGELMVSCHDPAVCKGKFLWFRGQVKKLNISALSPPQTVKRGGDSSS